MRACWQMGASLSSNRPEPRVLQVVDGGPGVDDSILSSNRPEPRVLQGGRNGHLSPRHRPFIQSTRAKGTARHLRGGRAGKPEHFHPIDPSQGYCKAVEPIIVAQVPYFHPIDPSQGYCKHKMRGIHRFQPPFHPIDPSQGYCKIRRTRARNSSSALSSNRPEPRVLQGPLRVPTRPTIGSFIQSTRAKGTARR